MKIKKSVKKEMIDRGMSFEQLKQKFGTLGEMNAFYKKHKIPKYHPKLRRKS